MAHPPEESMVTVQEFRLTELQQPTNSLPIQKALTTEAQTDHFMEQYLEDPNVHLIFVDGSYTPPSRHSAGGAGWAWAHFRNTKGGGRVSPSDLILEDYGSVSDIGLRKPDSPNDANEVNFQYNCLHSELAALGMALLYIDKQQESLVSTKIVIGYDSTVAKGLTTGENTSNDTRTTDIIASLKTLLTKINSAKRMVAESLLQRTAHTILDANHIQFRWIKSHTGLDVGNAWVDARAKAGSQGKNRLNPDRPIPYLPELNSTRLHRSSPTASNQNEATTIMQSRESLIRSQHAPVIQPFPYAPITLLAHQDDDPDITIPPFEDIHCDPIGPLSED